METINAKIESVSLGYENHGLLTISIVLDYGGSSQGFGGYNMSHNGEYLMKWVRGILDTVGVESWEKLKGKMIRVQRADGWNGKIIAIGNILEDKWFNPKDLIIK